MADLGYTSAYTFGGNASRNQYYFLGVVSPAQDITLDSMSVYLFGSTTARIALYSGTTTTDLTDNTALTLIEDFGEATSVGDQTVTVSSITNPTISASTRLWLVCKNTSFQSASTLPDVYGDGDAGYRWFGANRESTTAFGAIQTTGGASYTTVPPMYITYTVGAPSATITNIDGDNNVQAGQSNVSIVTSGIDPASVTQAVTLGGETLTINSWTDSGGNALINVDIPLHINAEWGTTHELAVTHDGGTTTLSGVTLSAPTGWETVSFSTIPDTGTTESFYEYSQSDATVGNFTAQVGDTLAFTSATGLTIDGSSIPVVDPAATVTGSYKWWDNTLETWSSTSTYTITDNGIYTGEPANDVTAIVQPMISNMIKDMVN